MMLTHIALSLGFFNFFVSLMNNLISFGLITGLTFIVVPLGYILLAMELMAIISSNRPVTQVEG